MRAALYSRFGDPATVLDTAQAPQPVPGPGEVRIRTVLAPIHNHDLLTIRGLYGYKPTLPAIGGSEALGTVDAVGEGVAHVQPGQRVVAASVHGTWAEAFVAPARMVIPMPDGIADETAAQLVAMPLSALMLLEFLQARPGQWIVQNTANGAVGKSLAMLATARGIKVANLVRSEDAAAQLRALGIEHVFVTASDGWKAQVQATLGEGLAAAAVDSIGGDASGDLVELLGHHGTLVSFGVMSGQPMHIPAGGLIYKEATVKGFWGSKVSTAMAVEDKRRLVGELLQRAASGELRLPVDAVFPLDQVAEAAAAAQRGGRDGKVLLRV
ncbi:zinc-binding dehydrogenase [Stenotrophomonas sp. 24(2023)]|uniref:zinc-binding dehydrogenase n=1 Tax=Stenotrophomonas sp. 24(2023) TaxID=3068324 RepID=UPI0027E0EC97|nr:zinc-binding dehydrogenase [Stenotrophomonas sp. 24(2023)]WMJ69470.1 zinc-binding dehydrogenase [Stenotrophomonas sp. 24(2023)]